VPMMGDTRVYRSDRSLTHRAINNSNCAGHVLLGPGMVLVQHRSARVLAARGDLYWHAGRTPPVFLPTRKIAWVKSQAPPMN